MTRVEHWAIPGRVWAVLAAWGLAVLLISALLSAWIVSVQREQDRAMCAMIDDIFLSGPEPVAGPAGDRSRSVRAGMIKYRDTLRCPSPD